MWISRNKFDTYENDSLVLWLDDEKPTRNDNVTYKYWIGICGIELKPYSKKWYDKYSYLTWEDEPIEVDIMPSDFHTEFIFTIMNNIRSGKYDGDLWNLFDDLLKYVDSKR